MTRALAVIAGMLTAVGCSSSSTGGGTQGTTGTTASGTTTSGSTSSGSSGSSGSGGTTGARAAPLPGYITLPSGFHGETIAAIPKARELAALPNGDLLVGTLSRQVFIVPNAEGAGAAGAPSVFITLADEDAQSVVYAPNGFIYVATTNGVWKVPYAAGDQSEDPARAVEIAQVRTGSVSPGTDGDVHVTSSVAVGSSTVYVGVGSSCNACTETDPTRATIQQMGLDGQNMTTLATRFRNAIALTVNPATGTLWAGGAGQDAIPTGHPYEYMDPVTLHGGVVDYGWPACEENQVPYTSGANCSGTVIPAVEFTAYATHIGAVFYPSSASGAYAFPASYRGSLFVTNHGSWHTGPSTPPSVAVVPMNGDAPVTPVDWSDPTVQWSVFAGGFGTAASSSYQGRPTGIAVGPQGSLFFADDQNGAVYRIRPGS